MFKKLNLILFLFFVLQAAFAQMTDNGVTKYGNEWIVDGQTYLKIKIAEDGVYKLDQPTLKNAGFPGDINGSDLQLFNNGLEIPITTSTNGIWSASDFLTFNGYFNKSEMDKYSFPNGLNDIINPKASMYSDTSVYFLTMNKEGQNLRTTIIPNILTNLPTAENFIIRISEQNFKDIPNAKTEYQSSSGGYHAYINTPFVPGKGMVSAAYNQTYNLDCPGIINTGPAPVYNLRGVTNPGDLTLNLGHDLKFSMHGTEMFTLSSQYQQVLYGNLSYIDNSRILKPSGNTYALTNGHGNDLIRIGYIGITYPAELKAYDTNPIKFYLSSNNQEKYLEFDVSGLQVSNSYLTDSLGSFQLQGVLESGKLKFKLPENTGNYSYSLVLEPQYKTIQNVKLCRLRTFNEQQANYIILSHGLLMSGANSSVEQYAAYRRSSAGGGYNVEVYDVADIYNSFGYGLDYNPMSVKNLSNFLALNEKAKFMFIIGRGRDYKEIRNPADLATAIIRGYGVPSFGDYGSDNLLVSQTFDRLSLNLAVGRLPAVTQNEVLTYLNKIKNSDAAYNAPGDNESRQWTKNIIQLNGGNVGQPDQAAIAIGQKDAEEIIKSNKIAGFVTTFVKGSNETIGKASQDYFDLVNKGVSVVDYFGHGALSSMEYPVDIPSKYNNTERMPILIIKGCKTGNCQRDGSSIPSKLLYEDSYKNTGFRAVIGSISDSELYSLSNLARQFYTLWGSTHYGRSFGEIFQSTFNTPGLNASSESIQQLYVGDPALTVNPFPGPDYTVEPNSVKTTPENITSVDNNFSVSFNIQNLGTSSFDTLFYNVSYENGDKKTVETKKLFATNLKSTGTFNVEFDLDKTSTSGENSIYIILDPDNKIAESIAPQAELNNEYVNSLGVKGYKFFVRSSVINTVYPARFAIIDTSQITLSAFSQAIHNDSRTYNWALDTTELFNSPALKVFSSNSQPGHIEWTPDFTLSENVVYYWRITKDSISAAEPFNIATSSFTYIKDKTGFSQSHNGQFRENNTEHLIIEGNGNNTLFGTRNYNFKYNNGFVNDQNANFISGISNDVNFRSFKSHLDFGNYNDGLIGVVWFKRDSFLKPYYSGQAPFGSIPVPNIDVHFYLMYETNNAASRINMVNYIEDFIPEEDIVFLFTHVKEAFPTLHEQEWAADSLINNGRNIFNTLEKRGAKLIRNLLDTGSKPYTVMFDKKTGLLIDEDMAVGNEIINSEANLLCHSDFGSIEQTFGTSANWKQFEFQPKNAKGKKDSLIYTLTAIHKSEPSNNYVIFESSVADAVYQSVDLTSVNAALFPKIRLNLRISEATLYGGLMDGFDYLRFISDELPEGSLIHDDLLFDSDSIAQGKPLNFSIKSKNIGREDMDSMAVRFTLRSTGNNSFETVSRFEKLPVGGFSEYKFNYDTKSLNGNYDFICEMNPEDDQPELFHGNNIYTRKLFIQGDLENPLVDATFDGERIFNGDIVSSQPLIKITIRDENKLFPLDDPSLFNVFLVNSFGQDTLIPLTSPEMKFFPADPSNLLKKNEAVIEFKPPFLQYPTSFSGDGEYSIRVTATDVAGNQSGKYDFEKRFRIINKKSVSNVFNYPNPFSTATRFVFTLTGSELPTYYKMQIMSVSGKVVREITQDELGPLKIGKHLSNYVWDGTDQYGDKLANGVYLYRMILKDQDKKNYEKLEEGKNTDQYFDGDWGKMVIIR